MHDRRIRDDLFLLAHDDAGRLVVAEASLEAGLAGATLIDLLLSGQIAVLGGRLQVIDPVPGPATPKQMPQSTRLAANTDPCGPRAWVNWISHGSYERVAEGLAAAGTDPPRDRATARPGHLAPVPADRA